MSVHAYTTYHARCDNENWDVLPGKKIGYCQWIGDTSYETKSEATAALRAHDKECEYKP